MSGIPARYWTSLGNGDLQCRLCPHGCRIKEGSHGICGIRENKEGELTASAYGIYPAVHMDPIEKKPLNHFLPGSQVLSAGSVGCNLNCRHCQNWSLARDGPGGKEHSFISPSDMLKLSGRDGSIGVAFTYNEPTINHEYLMDVCPSLRSEGRSVVMVTNGYLSPEPWEELMEVTDAANIDVKGFTEDFYREVTGGKLRPVLDNVKTAVDLEVHVEIAYLVIPGKNDDDGQVDGFIDWVVDTLDSRIPVHFNRFHPDHRMLDVPATPRQTLEGIRGRAMGAGVKYVFIGNMAGKGYNTTCCPRCRKPVIKRDHFFLPSSPGMKDGRCPGCGEAIKGVWSK